MGAAAAVATAVAAARWEVRRPSSSRPLAWTGGTCVAERPGKGLRRWASGQTPGRRPPCSQHPCPRVRSTVTGRWASRGGTAWVLGVGRCPRRRGALVTCPQNSTPEKAFRRSSNHCTLGCRCSKNVIQTCTGHWRVTKHSGSARTHYQHPLRAHMRSQSTPQIRRRCVRIGCSDGWRSGLHGPNLGACSATEAAVSAGENALEGTERALRRLKEAWRERKASGLACYLSLLTPGPQRLLLQARCWKPPTQVMGATQTQARPRRPSLPSPPLISHLSLTLLRRAAAPHTQSRPQQQRPLRGHRGPRSSCRRA